jgi:NAD(P)-dependent dehydrogenase (short-subunit alcohol dehydrogenase family)
LKGHQCKRTHHDSQLVYFSRGDRGASGLGEATARRLASYGVHVAIFDFNPERGEVLATEIGGIFCAVDVTKDDQVDAAFEKARAANGQERLLVNCAGIGPATKTASRNKTTGAITHHPLDQFERVIQVNLVGSFRCGAKSSAGMMNLPRLKTNSIQVNAASSSTPPSVAAQDGQMGQSAYSASKAGSLA